MRPSFAEKLKTNPPKCEERISNSVLLALIVFIVVAGGNAAAQVFCKVNHCHGVHNEKR